MAPKSTDDPNLSDLMVIRNVTPNVSTFSVPLIKLGRVQFGGRGTVVKLSSGSLAVFSPVNLTEETKAKVSEMGGDLSYIVATNYEHHLNISAWATEYPSARIIGPEGLLEKRAANENVGNEEFSVVFTKENRSDIKISDDFDADFSYEYIPGHANKEIAFFYKPDRVLIAADLLFSLPATEQHSKLPGDEKSTTSGLGRYIESVAGSTKWLKRINWYIAAKDRDSFNQSLRRIAEWDFITVIPCHGDCLENNGKDRFLDVFDWNLKGHMK